MSAKYYDEWKSHDDLRGDYPDAPDDNSIVFAGYTYEDYSGSAFVVFVRDGKVFENHDGHCSCHGLEDWAPEETSLAALRMRKEWQPELDRALTAFFGPEQS